MLQILFSHLYTLVPLLSLSAYLPQIALLLRTPGPAPDISLRSWATWVASGVVTFGYGFCCLHDLKFCIASCCSVVPITMVCCIVVYKRYAPRVLGGKGAGAMASHSTP